MIQVVRKFTKSVGADGAVLLTVLGYVISAVGSPATSFLIVHNLSEAEQGYHYTFQSVLALQMLFELGFAQCIVQFISHEFSKISVGSDGRLSGDPDAISRSKSLLSLGFRQFAVIAVSAFIGIGTIGSLFFARRGLDTNVHWLLPWWLLCLANAFTLYLTGHISALQGCGKVSWTAGLKVVSNLIRIVVLSISLWCGASLYSTCIAGFSAAFVCMLVIFWRWRSPYKAAYLNYAQGSIVSWRKEIWPYQWKLGFSWISGFFIFNSIGPLVFDYFGSNTAGRFGLTWTLCLNVVMISSAWTATKMPEYCNLVAKKEWFRLDHLWRTTTLASVAVSLLGFFTICMGTYLLNIFVPSYGQRLLEVLPTILLCFALLVSNIIGALANYLRSFRREPFMMLSIFYALVAFVFSCIGAKFGSVLYVSVGYLIGTIIMLPLAFNLFGKLRRKWIQEGIS